VTKKNWDPCWCFYFPCCLIPFQTPDSTIAPPSKKPRSKPKVQEDIDVILMAKQGKVRNNE